MNFDFLSQAVIHLLFTCPVHVLIELLFAFLDFLQNEENAEEWQMVKAAMNGGGSGGGVGGGGEEEYEQGFKGADKILRKFLKRVDREPTQCVRCESHAVQSTLISVFNSQLLFDECH